MVWVLPQILLGTGSWIREEKAVRISDEGEGRVVQGISETGD